MASNVKYLSTSWKLLNLDGKKWILHAFVLALLNLIPVIGTVFTLAYIYTWTNRTAWGLYTSPCSVPKDKSKMFSFGFKMFVTSICLTVVVMAVFELFLYFTLSIPFIGAIISLISLPLSIFVNVFIAVCVQRAAIYNQIKAAFSIPQIFDLCSRDWNGLIKLCGLYLVVNIPLMVASVPLVVVPVVMAVAPILFDGVPFTVDLTSLVLQTISSILVPVSVGILLLIFLYVISSFIFINAVAVWIAQFYPECWGASNEYVPINPGPVAHDTVEEDLNLEHVAAETEPSVLQDDTVHDEASVQEDSTDKR